MVITLQFKLLGGDGYINSERSTKSPRWKISVVGEVNIRITTPVAGGIPDRIANTDSTVCTIDNNKVLWRDKDTGVWHTNLDTEPLEAGHT